MISKQWVSEYSSSTVFRRMQPNIPLTRIKDVLKTSMILHPFQHDLSAVSLIEFIISCLLLIYLIPRYDSNKKKKKNHQQRDKLCCAGTKAPSHINTQSLPLVLCLCSCFSFISLLKGTQEGWGREEEETSCSCTLRHSLPRSSVLLVVFVSDNESDDDGDDARDNWGGSCGVKGNFKNPSELFSMSEKQEEAWMC